MRGDTERERVRGGFYTSTCTGFLDILNPVLLLVLLRSSESRLREEALEMEALCRSFARFAYSPHSTARLLLQPTAFLLQSHTSSSSSTATATRRKPKSSKYAPPETPTPETERPRPRKIPFQPQVANAVNLIGHVRMPVQFQISSDGKSWAATVIARGESSDSDSHHLWIPVIFEGDLAHIASCHLKENDCIHVAGELSAEPHHFEDRVNVQVMVQSLSFVEGYSEMRKCSSLGKQEEISSLSEVSEYHYIDQSWEDLLSKPDEWWDIRSTGNNLKGGAFERKKNGELLFIDSSTPKWIREKIESMTFDCKSDVKSTKASEKKVGDSLLSSWSDLLDDPKQWWDFRDCKHKGLVKPKYPDFKRKDGSVALWINTAPTWIISKLEGLELDVQTVKFRQTEDHKGEVDVQTVKSKEAKNQKGSESWKNLATDPSKWWDNRKGKKNARAPDFKHKETGEALWLDNAPSWVLSKLPPLKA